MEKGLYMAAVNGDTGFLTDARVREIETGTWDEYLQSKTHQNNNIMHIATLHNQTHFLENVLAMLNFSPLKLISQKNAVDDTSLHIASKNGNKPIVELLVRYSMLNLAGKKKATTSYGGEIEVAEEEGDVHELRPWMIQNLKGNTALHEALISAKVEVARYLVELDAELAGVVNKSNETPLHLAVKCIAIDDKQLVMETIELMNKKQASLTYKGSKCPTKDESLSILNLLLQTNSAALYIHDEDGLTPLLRAAVVRNQLPAIEAIVNQFPDSAETRNFEGQSVLHLIKLERYKDAKALLGIPQFFALKDQQDFLGNTPAHVAVTNSHFGMIKTLLECSANFTIKNKEGLSAAALLQQPKTSVSNIATLKLGNKEMKINLSQSPQQLPQEKMRIIRRAMEDADGELLSKRINMLESLANCGMLGGGNIVHGVLKAWKRKHHTSEDNHEDTANKPILDFIEEVLQRYPHLSWQTDPRGDTPFHIIARDYEISPSLFVHIKTCYENSQKELSVGGEEYYCPPWRVKNEKGNTPLHDAILYSERPETVVKILSEVDKDVFAFVNNQNETPLHVLCRRQVQGDNKKRDEELELIDVILKANIGAAYRRDTEGMTPLLSAAKEGNINEVIKICKICPESAQLCDNSGNTYWHLMIPHELSEEEEEELLHHLCNSDHLPKELLNVKNDEGMSPVQQAIHNQEHYLLKVLLKCPHLRDDIENELKAAGINTCLYFPFINRPKYVPFKLQQLFWGLWKKVRYNKSIFGVQESEINNYAQTLGVIAVLLATVAFTAAFTVPGGFRQDHQYLNYSNGTSVDFSIGTSGATKPKDVTTDLIGSPVLLGSKLIPFLTRASYYVFIVSDISTMCLSTFVLYCLMWAMKGYKDKMILIDMSIFSLLICFYTTMIMFMTGIFATTFRVIPSTAIATMVVCSVVMMLLNRWFFPIKTLFLYFMVLYEVWVECFENLCNCNIAKKNKKSKICRC